MIQSIIKVKDDGGFYIIKVRDDGRTQYRVYEKGGEKLVGRFSNLRKADKFIVENK